MFLQQLGSVLSDPYKIWHGHTRNKPSEEFFIFSKSKMAAGGQKSKIGQILPHKSHFFCNNLDPVHRIQTKFGMDILLDPRNKPADFFSFFSKSKMAAGGQNSKIGQILPHKSQFGSSFGSGSSDLDQIWQVDTTQPKEQAYGRIFDLSQNPRWPPQPPLRQITKSVIT